MGCHALSVDAWKWGGLHMQGPSAAHGPSDTAPPAASASSRFRSRGLVQLSSGGRTLLDPGTATQGWETGWSSFTAALGAFVGAMSTGRCEMVSSVSACPLGHACQRHPRVHPGAAGRKSIGSQTPPPTRSQTRVRLPRTAHVVGDATTRCSSPPRAHTCTPLTSLPLHR